MPDFSFEQDVAPYASNFFARTQSNPLLSAAKKTQLTGDLLDKLESFKKATDEDEDRSLQKEIRRTQLDRERIALDDARVEFQQKREAIEAEPLVSAEFDKIFEGVTDPNEQQRRLGLFAMRNANVLSNSKSLAMKYKFAADAITKPALSSKDLYQMQRQAERDRAEDIKWRISEERSGRTEQRRSLQDERAHLDRIFDVKLKPTDKEIYEASTQKRQPIPEFENKADRGKLLSFLSEYGNDTSQLEGADDQTVYDTADRFRRKLISGETAANKQPVVDFNLEKDR